MRDSHSPYPGMVIDKGWNLVRVNATAQMMVGDTEGMNMVRLVHSDAWRSMVEYWSTVAWAMIARLRDDVARHPHDGQLEELLAFAPDQLSEVPRPRGIGSEHVICPRFRIGDLAIPTITVVAQFGSPRDVTIDELRIELIYPEDEVGQRVFAELAAR